METKVATAVSVCALFAFLSLFHSPVEAFPTGKELKAYPTASSNNHIDCSGSKDGEKIPSPNSCSEFYECAHGVAYLFQCANMTDGGQLYFNATLQSCNWPSEVDCEITSTEPTTVTEPSNDSTPNENDQFLRVFAAMADATIDCSQAENGDKIPSPTNCSEYFVCVMGRAYLYQCPIMAAGGRLYFDPELGVCNWPWMVDCEITTTESPATTTMVTERSSTTSIEPVSTTSQMNSTTLNPTTEVTTVSINTTTVEPITSEIPQTSTQPDDLSTTPEVTSSQPLSTTTTQQTIYTTTQKVTEASTTIVDSTTAEPTTSHGDSTTAYVTTTEASTPAINTTTMEPITSKKPETSTQPDDSSTTSEQPSSTEIPVSTTMI